MDWSSFTVRISVSASARDLYKAWTTRKGLEHWFLRLAEFKKKDGTIKPAQESIEEGDSYRWLWYGWPDDMVEMGHIIAANDKDQLEFQFGKAGICNVTIRQELGEIVVELIQKNIPDDEFGRINYHLGCKNGWTFYLTNLKSVMEGGLDLRNRNEQLTRVINS